MEIVKSKIEYTVNVYGKEKHLDKIVKVIEINDYELGFDDCFDDDL